MGKKQDVVLAAVVNPEDAVFADGVPTNTPGEMLKPLPEPEGGWPADEFTGVGGSYVRDPFTGVRRRADPVAE